MVPLWMQLAAAAVTAVQAPAARVEQHVEPRAVVHDALRAVEGDSVGRVRARWAERLRADPGARAAALGVATLARFTYDYPDADRRYAALSAAATPDGVARYALLGAAWGAYDRGATPRSDTLFARARTLSAAARDSAAEAEALIGLAMARAPMRGAPAGLALIDSARRIAPPGDAALGAQIAVRRTILLAVTSDRRAPAEGARALALARRGGDRRAEALAWRAIALDLHLRGQDDSALVVLADAERLQRDARDASERAMTLIRHADIYHSRSDYGRMKALTEQGIADANASDNQYVLTSAHVSLGVVALGFGDLTSARTHFAEAGRLSAAHGDTSALVIVWTYQANLALAAGDLARARALAARVRDFHHGTSDATEEFEVLRTRAAVERRAGAYDAARAWLDTADVVARVHRLPAQAASLGRDRAALALARGDLPGARRFLTAYLATLDTGDHAVRHRARAMLAEAAARAGDYAAAERELTAAGDELDAWRATLSDRAVRALAFQARGFDYDVGASSAPFVIAALASHGRAPAAFELAERRRARMLADLLVRAATLAETTTAGASLGASRGRGRAGAAVAPLLADGGTALLEYVTGAEDAPTTLFVVTRGAGGAGPAVTAHVLPSATSLAPAAARLAALLEAGADPGPFAKTLGDAVLAPALGGLPAGVRRLVVVPDGPLHALPFDALRTADGRFVVERYAVSLAPSATVAGALRARPAPAARPERLLAFGDPTFGDATRAPNAGGPEARGADAGATFRSAFDSGGGLPRLAASGDEARDVARYAPEAVVRLGDEATAAYLKHAPLDAFDVIHFATHALVDERSVARTALALAPGAGESGFVSAGDLAALHLAARLVVLSACRSAGGVVVDGEGVQGLTAPLLEAGARSVVATEWRIRDRGTARFVDAFYGHLARGLPVADALRAAKLDAIARGAPPAEWAAFTVVGDPTVVVPLRAPPPAARWPWAAAGALGLAAGAAALRRRRA